MLKTLSFSPFLTFLCFPLRCRCWQYARQSVKICLIDRVLIDFLFKLKAMFVLAESLFQNNLKRSPPKYLVGCRSCDWANSKVLWCKNNFRQKIIFQILSQSRFSDWVRGGTSHFRRKWYTVNWNHGNPSTLHFRMTTYFKRSEIDPYKSNCVDYVRL